MKYFFLFDRMTDRGAPIKNGDDREINSVKPSTFPWLLRQYGIRPQYLSVCNATHTDQSIYVIETGGYDLGCIDRTQYIPSSSLEFIKDNNIPIIVWDTENTLWNMGIKTFEGLKDKGLKDQTFCVSGDFNNHIYTEWDMFDLYVKRYTFNTVNLNYTFSSRSTPLLQDNELTQLKQAKLSGINDGFPHQMQFDTGVHMEYGLQSYATVVFQQIENDVDIMQITESLFYPFLNMTYPLVVGPKRILSALEDLGFDVFRNVISSSYDSVSDVGNRIKYCTAAANDFTNQDINHIHNNYQSNLSSLYTNRTILLNGINKNLSVIFENIMNEI